MSGEIEDPRPFAFTQRCVRCLGSGRDPDWDPTSPFFGADSCSECQGRGSVTLYVIACHRCNGDTYGPYPDFPNLCDDCFHEERGT